MANEDDNGFEDRDSAVYSYDALNVGDRRYKYVDEPAVEAIFQIKKK